MSTEAVEVAAVHSQTLDRGLRALEAVVEASGVLTIDALAEVIGLHRSVTYRMVRTLEAHRLVSRDGAGLLHAGTGLSVLARSVAAPLQAVAAAELSDLANRLAMTAFLVVRDGDEAVTILSVEPRHAVAHVVYRPGVRHPVDRGAPGVALLSGEPRRAGERPEVEQARHRGWAVSSSEVLPGMTSVSAPIRGGHGVAGACSVVFVQAGHDLDAIGAAVIATASAIAQGLP